ncbi:MAG TPA: hypothetical protein VII93_03535 [Anaerolineales bacterium]
MKPSDASRRIVLLILTLILMIFLVGTLPAISPAHAAILSATIPTLNPSYAPLATDDGSILTPGPSETPLLTPAPTPTPTPFPPPIGMTTDMTGIIALAILVVVATLVGMIWGGAPYRRTRSTKK